MKCRVNEYSHCFDIELTAETLAEAILLARLGVNRTKELRCCDVSAMREGPMYGYIVIGKRAREQSEIPHAK